MGDEPDHKGHRARLRARLLDSGGDALADYELVEYLLALAIPRRDTKPLAKALLREFGSLAKLIGAEPEALRRIDGLGDGAIAALKIVQAANLRMLKGEIAGRSLLSSWDALLDYLRADMGALDIERVRVLYLNSRNMLLRDEIASEGSVDQSAIYAREVIKRALELGAAAIILVHNHPSGIPEPSRQDIAITREIAAAAAKLGIQLHDHIIVGDGDYRSMRGMGLI
ncbi:RadC family protein [Sphingopyxis sp. PET50]|uniref:RadC family protein n=1 Tax=Sphingopyxis sp. PET50 TaxID=2976533 RepID=UPI0021AFA808|nr:DNA repair protein RadC [Sphingopyxis sp. PET50]